MESVDTVIDLLTDSEYMGHVARLPCLPCRLLNLGDTPAQVHHARKHGGARNRLHKLTIPVCPYHHTQGDTSIHRQRRMVEDNYGMSEMDMALKTRHDVVKLMLMQVS